MPATVSSVDWPWQFSPEVKEALAKGRPIVALESTLIAHGLPYPDNLAAAKAMEEAVRSAGAVPATVAILDGRIGVGINAAALERLGQSSQAAKSNRADLPAYLSASQTAATTVSATIFLAHQAGIAFFATGGIGGVHRGETWDISADLLELARTPMLTVCSGAKSLLHLPRTWELLEALAIPVVGYGTREFPAFYLPNSGLRLVHAFDEVQEVAAFHRWHRRLGGQGLLVVQPPPPSELSSPQVEAWIEQAEDEAAGRGMAGKDRTPFILSKLHEWSAGLTLQVNQALAVQNARLAGLLAAADFNLGD